MITLEELNAMSREEKIETLRGLKNSGVLIRDIIEALNFRHNTDYYYYLKKNRIYDDIVRSGTIRKLNIPEPAEKTAEISTTITQSEPVNNFEYELSNTLSGSELSERLIRLAELLKNGEKYDFTLQIKGQGI